MFLIQKYPANHINKKLANSYKNKQSEYKFVLSLQRYFFMMFKSKREVDLVKIWFV
jgi:hypothetical protein